MAVPGQVPRRELASALLSALLWESPSGLLSLELLSAQSALQWEL